MLAVIVIISALASMLFPVIATSKQASKRVVCLSNLHQIGVATDIYLGDCDDHYPQAVNGISRIKPRLQLGRPPGVNPKNCITTPEALMPDVKDARIFLCPEDKGADYQGHVSSPTFAPDNAGSSYEFAELFDGQSSSYWQDPAGLNWSLDGWRDWHWGAPPQETSIFHRWNALAYDGHVHGIVGQIIVADWKNRDN